MDPTLDGYVSLEEETTMSPPQSADSPNAKVPCQEKPAEDDAAASEADTAEWKQVLLKSPAFMDMDLPGIIVTGVDGNLAIHRVCLPKEAYLLICGNRLPPLQLHKWQVNYKLLLEGLITKSFVKG